jgi:hypothetical protein
MNSLGQALERELRLEERLDETRSRLAHLIGYYSVVGDGRVPLAELQEVYRLAGGTADLVAVTPTAPHE